jgi:hypothetical protein
VFLTGLTGSFVGFQDVCYMNIFLNNSKNKKLNTICVSFTDWRPSDMFGIMIADAVQNIFLLKKYIKIIFIFIF